MPHTPKHRPQIFDKLPSARPCTPLLDSIDAPSDLHALGLPALLQLCDELRAYLLYACAQSGGHFGANLGVVELTVALHCVFESPKDALIWDVGHQAYAHKALTGRRERLPSIRSFGGLTAFPERGESEHDAFGVGHSSTAISAALGMRLARNLLQKNNAGKDGAVVAIVGDGALTGGMAFEAINDAVAHDADILIILNDNDMSISPAVGGFARHLAQIWQSGQARVLQDGAWTWQSVVRDDRRARHGATMQGQAHNLFSALGVDYYGALDGHDLPSLITALQDLKCKKGVRLLHIHTQKGKGYLPAESDPVGFHALAKTVQDAQQGIANQQNASNKAQKFSDIFGAFLCDVADGKHGDDLAQKLVAITPAMALGSGMVQFAQQHPNRFFDVAIAEQHALTLAAGFACENLKPVVAIYSTFLQRGLDQFIHDVALQNLDVTLAIDRAGLVGEDGATHAGVFDMAFCRSVPNTIIATPKDEHDCYNALLACYAHPYTALVRYPRGLGVGAPVSPLSTPCAYAIGKAQIVFCSDNWHKTDKSVALLAFGTLCYEALLAKDLLCKEEGLLDIALCVVDMRWVKPLDGALIKSLGASHIVTIEEHQRMGGAGSAVGEFLVDENITTPLLAIGIDDKFIAQATHQQQRELCRLDSKGIVQQIHAWLQKR